MAVGDVEAVGAHCQMEYCNQLDFLPFRCDSCHGTYCLDHRLETSHKCSKAGAWAKARTGRSTVSSTSSSPKPNILNHEKQCAATTCKTLVDTPLTPGVHCQTCNRRYCLKHRMKEDHGCSKLTPLGARPPTFSSAQKEKGMAALTKLKSWGLNKKAAMSNTTNLPILSKSTSRKSAASNLAATNALKTAAKGDAKVPVDKRVYLHVEASADTTKAKYPTGKFFYSKEWSVGRVLDVAAKALQVENINNRVVGEEERLRVFHVEGGRLVDFSEKLGDVVQTGNTIVLLRGVGPPVPDLIEA
ncbi:hypothetical protein BT63DRAFT_410428 [Microthyrium microscopicum]|uniref:AN1-type domain-containing protein n=1 Tax=Microthyrium microscopicum TaxID=703497 RepID=A0A6A6UPU4_9PEZI|nr:hypothetical protein BT63DRAFT_410428 [Microthyrium microscopicum]